MLHMYREKKDMINGIPKIKEKSFHFAFIPWIILFISLFTINLRSGIEPTSLTIANSFRIFLVGLSCCVSFFYLLTSRRVFGHIFDAPIFCFLLFGVVGIISGAYASEGYYAIWKAIEVCVDVIAIVVVFHVALQENAFLKLLRIAILLNSILLMSIIIGAFISPGRAFIIMPRAFLHYQLSGVFPIINPNTVGFISAFLCFLSFTSLINDGKHKLKFFYLLSFCIAFVSLILAQARTSIIALIVATIVYLFFDQRWKSLVTVIVGLTLLFSFNISINYFYRGQNIEQLKSMSSRTVAWKSAWDLFKESPIIGNGFASAGKYDVLKGSPTTTLHGSIFEVLVGVGVVGFLPWITAVIITGLRLIWPRGNIGRIKRNNVSRSIRAEFIAIYMLIVVRMLTSSLLASHDAFFLLFLILSAYSVVPEMDYSGNE
jgi:O-antigen ligase